MADPTFHHTHTLNQIAVDYNPKACTISNSITLAYDRHGGSQWRSATRFLYGTFSAVIRCHAGNTVGLEGDKSQDEIDFEFLGKDRTVVQTNFFTAGAGNREQIHDLGFDCADGFHEYSIKWGPDLIEWAIDGVVVRRAEKAAGEDFPGGGRGSMWGCDEPYVCVYKDIQVPPNTALES